MSTDFWKLRLKDRNIRIVTKLRFWKDVALYKEEVINDTTQIFCPHHLTMQADKNFNFIKTTIIQKKPDKCLFLKFRYLYYVILSPTWGPMSSHSPLLSRAFVRYLFLPFPIGMFTFYVRS